MWPEKSASGFLFEYDLFTDDIHELWETNFVEEATNFSPQLLLSDINDDNQSDLIVTTFGKCLIYNGLTGSTRFSSGFNGQFLWDTKTARRNYGNIYVKKNPLTNSHEITIIADSVSLHISKLVINTDDIDLLYDVLVSEAYSGETMFIRSTKNSVHSQYLAFSLFNSLGNDSWSTYINTNQYLNLESCMILRNRYLYDVVDIDNDGKLELFVGESNGFTNSYDSFLEIYTLNENNVSLVWTSPEKGKFLLDNYFKTDSSFSTSNKENTAPLLTYLDPKLGTIIFVEIGNKTVALHKNRDHIYELDRIQIESPIFVSINNNKLDSALFTTDENISIWNKSGEIFHAKLGGLPAMPIVLDYDNNGIPNLLYSAYGSVHNIELSMNHPTKSKWIKDGFGLYALSNRKANTVAGRIESLYNLLATDFNGDGMNELLIGSNTDDSAQLELLDFEGVTIWTTPFPEIPADNDQCKIYSWMSFGSKEKPLIFVSGLLSGFNTEIGFVLDATNGEIQWSAEIISSESGGNIGFGPYAGYPASTYIDNSTFFLAKTQLIDIKPDGWNRIASVPNYYGTPIFYDRTNPSHFILVAGYDSIDMYDLNSIPGSSIWTIKTEPWEYYSKMPGVADINGDGNRDLGMVDTDGKFKIIDIETGLSLGAVDTKSAAGNIATNDLNGDGISEFVVPLVNGSLNSYGWINNELKQVWSLDLGTSLGDVIIADALGLQKPQIIVSGSDGFLYFIGDESD